MLLIIELLFFIAGLWAVITGRLPTALFRFLFGKGRYVLPSGQVRLFGIFLLSPFAFSLLLVFLLASFWGHKGTGYVLFFELAYNFVAIITSIFVVRKARHPEINLVEDSQTVGLSSQQKPISYGLRLLIVFGIIILVCITSVSFISLVFAMISSIKGGIRITGDFWWDVFPLIFIVLIIGVGSFSIYRLVKIIARY